MTPTAAGPPPGPDGEALSLHPPEHLARIGIERSACAARRSCASSVPAGRSALKARVLLLPALLLVAPLAAAGRASADDAPRFVLRASLQPAPELVQSGPYRLGGTLTRQAQTAQPLEGAGFQLMAEFAPKSTCLFPIALFRNGFESTP